MLVQELFGLSSGEGGRQSHAAPESNRALDRVGGISQVVREALKPSDGELWKPR